VVGPTGHSREAKNERLTSTHRYLPAQSALPSTSSGARPRPSLLHKPGSTFGVHSDDIHRPRSELYPVETMDVKQEKRSSGGQAFEVRNPHLQIHKNAIKARLWAITVTASHFESNRRSYLAIRSNYVHFEENTKKGEINL